MAWPWRRTPKVEEGLSSKQTQEIVQRLPQNKTTIPPRTSTLQRISGFVRDIASTGLEVYKSIEDIRAIGKAPEQIQPVERTIIVSQPRSTFSPPGIKPIVNFFTPGRKVEDFIPSSIQERVGYGIGQGLSPRLSSSLSDTISMKSNIALILIAAVGLVLVLSKR